MAGKYKSFEIFLSEIPGSMKEIMLTFDQVEDILKSKLPSSAYEDRRWWDHETEGNHVSKRSWANAGWKIDDLNVHAKWVKFIRA